MAHAYNTLFFEIKINIPTIWGRTLGFGNKIAQMYYLYRRPSLYKSRMLSANPQIWAYDDMTLPRVYQ